MNNLQDRINRLANTIRVNSTTRENECNICKDVEWIVDPITNVAKACKCQEVKKYRKILENCGISEVFKKMTFDNYIPKNKTQQEAKAMAYKYANEFKDIKGQRQNSILLGGQVGSGKTHLSMAICNVLMKNGNGVIYMPYKEVITHLKQAKTDIEVYQKEIHKYKNAPVLMLDDLFKLAERNGKVNNTDIDIIYEIVNDRYMKNKPMIVSTEYDIDYLLDVDEATGSRIVEMSKGRIINFKGEKLNHRMV